MLKILKRILPASDIRNIRFFYVFTIFTNFWFLAANWLFFWLKFMSYQQLGVVDAVTFGAGLLMEIPSGAISDLLGKKKTIIAGTGMAFISMIFMATAQNMSAFFWANFFILVGWALNSGAVEALVYDTLLERKRDDEYDKVMSVSSSLASLTAIIAIFIGGYLYEVNFRLPTVFWAISYGFAFLFTFKLTEPKIDSEIFSWKTYWLQLKIGTMALFKPSLIAYSVVIFSLMGGYYLYDFGFVKPAIIESFGFSVFQQSRIFTVFSAIGATMVLFIPWLRRNISDKKGLYLLTLLLAGGFISSYFLFGPIGLVSILMIELSGFLVSPWISVVVNKEIESKHRATTLSALALISKIPYVLLAIIAGNFAENGQVKLFSLWVGIFILASIVISALVYKRNSLKTLRT